MRAGLRASCCAPAVLSMLPINLALPANGFQYSASSMNSPVALYASSACSMAGCTPVQLIVISAMQDLSAKQGPAAPNATAACGLGAPCVHLSACSTFAGKARHRRGGRCCLPRRRAYRDSSSWHAQQVRVFHNTEVKERKCSLAIPSFETCQAASTEGCLHSSYCTPMLGFVTSE